MLDSDGNVEELIPCWLEVGINFIYPMEVAAGMDVVALRRQFGKGLLIGCGMEKRILAGSRPTTLWSSANGSGHSPSVAVRARYPSARRSHHRIEVPDHELCLQVFRAREEVFAIARSKGADGSRRLQEVDSQAKVSLADALKKASDHDRHRPG